MGYKSHPSSMLAVFWSYGKLPPCLGCSLNDISILRQATQQGHLGNKVHELQDAKSKGVFFTSYQNGL